MKDSTRIRKLNEASDRIGGYKGAMEFLAKLPDNIGRKALRPAMQAAGAVGAQAAFAAASGRGTGFLATTARSAESVKGAVVFGKVGYFGKRAFHAWLVEHGHRIIIGGTAKRINKARRDYGKADRAKNPLNTGMGIDTGKRVPPHPILKPAYMQCRAKMEQVFAAEVIRRSDAMARRMAKEANGT